MESTSHTGTGCVGAAPAEHPLPLHSQTCLLLCGRRKFTLARWEQKENAAELSIQKLFCPEQQDSALGRRFPLVRFPLVAGRLWQG